MRRRNLKESRPAKCMTSVKGDERKVAEETTETAERLFRDLQVDDSSRQTRPIPFSFPAGNVQSARNGECDRIERSSHPLQESPVPLNRSPSQTPSTTNSRSSWQLGQRHYREMTIALSFYFNGCIKVMVSPFIRMRPGTYTWHRMSRKGARYTQRLPGLLLHVDLLGIIEHQVHILVKSLQTGNVTSDPL